MFSEVFVCPQWGLGLCPGGLCLGVSVQGSLSGGGLCLGGLCQGDLPYGKERAVRILLECILANTGYKLSCSILK